MIVTLVNPTMAIISILLLGFIPSFAQGRSSNQAGCARIDNNRPAQFISYGGMSETTSTVTLQLHNNSSCGIVVETDDRYPMRFTKLPNGGVKLETITSSQDEARLPLHYLVQDRRKWRAPRPAYGWGDSVFTYELLAGQSAMFTVPLSHFRKQLDIAVPFNYAWEGDGTIGMGVGGVVHRVYFLVEDLPETALRKRQSKK